MDSGWKIIRGAGGFVAKHSGKDKWSTSVHQTREQAIAAADTLEAGALATVEKQERERVDLRDAFGNRERDDAS